MRFKIFKGTLIGWQELFTDAAAFATSLGPARLCLVSHSASDGRGIVTVWYTDSDTDAPVPTLPLQLRFHYERGTLISWEELFKLIAARAARLTAEQIVSISHSDAPSNGVVTLWYWDTAAQPEPEPSPSPPEPEDRA